MVYFGVDELGEQQVAANIVAEAFAQRHALLQRGAHFVFGVQVFLQHLRHRQACREDGGAHIGAATEKQDAPQQGVSVLRLFFHFMVHALVQLDQAHVFVGARVHKVLVARGQFTAQQLLEVFDDLRISLHVFPCFQVKEYPAEWHVAGRIPLRMGRACAL